MSGERAQAQPAPGWSARRRNTRRAGRSEDGLTMTGTTYGTPGLARVFRVLLIATTLLIVALWAVPQAQASLPQPCDGIRQIDDPKGDGHHNNTDVTAAWFSEDRGVLELVVQVDQAVWEPAHDDSDHAGFAFLFTANGQQYYVRSQAWRSEPISWDYGTWSLAGGFVRQGFTTGSVTVGAGGAVVMTVPPTLGISEGDILTGSHVLTYDGIDFGVPHWVDRAPGGTAPGGAVFGADFVVGACGQDPENPVTTAVSLKGPAMRVGSGVVTVNGSVLPARPGVEVEITVRTGSGKHTSYMVQSEADGSFSRSVEIKEKSVVKAVATENGLSSQGLTVNVRAKVRIKVRKLRNGSVLVTGTTSPALPGRVLWLRMGEVVPSVRTNAANGRFRFRLRKPRSGRYEAVYIPFKARAERAISNKGTIR